VLFVSVLGRVRFGMVVVGGSADTEVAAAAELAVEGMKSRLGFGVVVALQAVRVVVGLGRCSGLAEADTLMQCLRVRWG